MKFFDWESDAVRIAKLQFNSTIEVEKMRLMRDREREEAAIIREKEREEAAVRREQEREEAAVRREKTQGNFTKEIEMMKINQTQTMEMMKINQTQTMVMEILAGMSRASRRSDIIKFATSSVVAGAVCLGILFFSAALRDGLIGKVSDIGKFVASLDPKLLFFPVAAVIFGIVLVVIVSYDSVRQMMRALQIGVITVWKWRGKWF